MECASLWVRPKPLAFISMHTIIYLNISNFPHVLKSGLTRIINGNLSFVTLYFSRIYMKLYVKLYVSLSVARAQKGLPANKI